MTNGDGTRAQWSRRTSTGRASRRPRRTRSLRRPRRAPRPASPSPSATRPRSSRSRRAAPVVDPVLHFDATCSGGGPTGTGTGTSSPILVTGLSNGVAYTCTVTATNVDGTSPSSSASSRSSRRRYPTHRPRSRSHRRTLSQVGFTPGAPNGSTITGYTATCTPVSAGTPGTGSGSSSPVVVTGLTDGNAYTCTVVRDQRERSGLCVEPRQLRHPRGTCPAAPTSVVATGGNGSATITFTAGANNGSAVLHFDASCTGTGPTGTGTAASSPISVTGLTNGVSYTCAVTATNRSGRRLRARRTRSRRRTCLRRRRASSPPPETLSVTIAFTPGANNGSPITAFNASCTGGGPTGTGTAATSPIHVTGLTNGNVYTCAVTATNTIGMSPPGTSNSFIPAITGPRSADRGGGDSARAAAGRRDHVVGRVHAPRQRRWRSGRHHRATPRSASPRTVVSRVRPRRAASSPIVVTGLTVGNTYTCTVTATSSKGTSVPSVASAPFASQTVPRRRRWSPRPARTAARRWRSHPASTAAVPSPTSTRRAPRATAGPASGSSPALRARSSC